MTRRIALPVIAALVLTVACSSGGGGNAASSNPSEPTSGGASSSSTTTTAPVTEGKVPILVTNDDGVHAPGIDRLVESLRAIPDVSVTVVAPAENQSGSGDRTSPGTVAAHRAKTASGRRAWAVVGTPADSVNWAFGNLHTLPQLVVSGVNQGQNLGPIAEVSGTVGAARTAARHGVDALAVSQGLGSPPDYALGARYARRWVIGHLAVIRDRRARRARLLMKIDVPTCPTRSVRGLVAVPLAKSMDNRGAVATPNCASRVQNPKDDIEAFNNGFAAESSFDADLTALH